MTLLSMAPTLRDKALAPDRIEPMDGARSWLKCPCWVVENGLEKEDPFARGSVSKFLFSFPCPISARIGLMFQGLIF